MIYRILPEGGSVQIERFAELRRLAILTTT
jgi:hypothetical protein